MSQDKLEEEAYSLIFNTLKHPIRRKIIRLLSDKPKTYSEILHELSMDSGHLNYHLENLGDIVTRTKAGKYALSSVGKTAVNLMTKVEEQHATTREVKQARRVSKTAVIFSVIFAIALLTSTVYALTFTTQQQDILFGGTQISVNLQPNQTYTYTITLKTLSFISGHGSAIGNNNMEVMVSPPKTAVNEWTQLVSNTELLLSGTFDIFITVYDPDQNELYHSRHAGNAAGKFSLNLGFEFTKSGNYSIQIENLGEACSETLIPQGNQITYQRPFFNYGIAGAAVLFIYPLMLLIVKRVSNSAKIA